MRAWTHLLLIAPVFNNWMWTDEMPRLLTLTGLKWQGLTSWHTKLLTEHAAEPENALQQHQAHAILTFQLNSSQNELQLRLTTETLQTLYTVIFPANAVDMPLSVMNIMASKITDWLAQQLGNTLDQLAEAYCPVSSPEQLGFALLAQQNTIDKAAFERQAAFWLKKTPDAHIMHRLMAERAVQARQFAQAIQHIQLAIKNTPENLPWLRGKDATLAGLSAILAGQAVIGQRWMEKAIAWAPALPAPKLHLGLTLEGLGDHNRAIEHLVAYQTLIPTDSRAMYALARLYSVQQSWNNVVAQYEQLLNYVEPDTWLYCDLANAYLQMDQIEKANQWFQRVIDTAEPDHPSVEMAKLALGMEMVF